MRGSEVAKEGGDRSQDGGENRGGVTEVVLIGTPMYDIQKIKKHLKRHHFVWKLNVFVSTLPKFDSRVIHARNHWG